MNIRESEYMKLGKRVKPMIRWLNNHQLKYIKNGKEYYSKPEYFLSSIFIHPYVRYTKGIIFKKNIDEISTHKNGVISTLDSNLAHISLSSNKILVFDKRMYNILKEFGEEFKFKTLEKCWNDG